jgi:hypothetical protein
VAPPWGWFTKGCGVDFVFFLFLSVWRVGDPFHLGLAYVLAKRDAAEYARLLDAAEGVIPTVIQPASEADALHNRVYAALDDPNWCQAVLSMLNQGPIEHAW